MPKDTKQVTIAEDEIRDHEINRMQRAMSHMLAAHQGASLIANNLRHTKNKLAARVREQDEQIAERDAQIKAMQAQLQATWRVAIRTAANVAEFTCGLPGAALAISAHEIETPEAIAEMLLAASGE